MNVTLLSAKGLRALAYATVLRRVGNCNVSMLEYGQSKSQTRVFPPHDSRAWWPLPDWLRVNWQDEYDLLAEQSLFLATQADLNSVDTRSLLSATEPDMVVYAGAAGSLVGADLLRVAPFLHMHPGRLPEFRGSTTIYWSLLMGDAVSVSAIYLSDEIDQGELVATKAFPNPISQSDVDGIFDAGIRAVLLQEIMVEAEVPPEGHSQRKGGADFYVIHPTLKNIVLSSLLDN